MQFSKLRIQGFKTFVDPTDVMIRDGLSGIVGPNGCGKSNLVEAMRWVMGENSFKNMRASGMDDVIFSGSGNRPSRNHAEVILTIDNVKRLAPAQFNDADILEVSRKIEREAGSTYKINGREVRARDVQLLFADASTGSRSPALVRQGQIAEIISAKPQARRRILEEAAGISGLYARRHEAEMRLKAAEANFERLDDVFAGLQTQVDSLKRQAKGAVKYRELSGGIRKFEATTAYIKFMDVLTVLVETEKSLEIERLSVASATSKQAEAAKLQAIVQERLPALREASAKAGAALNRLIIARDQLEAEEKRAVQRSGELTRQIAQIDADIMREKSLGGDASGVIEKLKSEKSELLKQAENTTREAEIAGALRLADEAVSHAEKSYSDATTALAEATARRNALDRALREAGERHAALDRQIRQLELEETRLTPEPDKSHELKAGLDLAIDRQKSLENEMLSSEDSLKKARLSVEETAKPLREAERKMYALETEVNTLRKLLAPSSKKYTPVLEQITVQKGYEKALAAALGEDLEASLDVQSPLKWVELEAIPEIENALSNFVTAPLALSRRLNSIALVSRETGGLKQKTLLPGQRLVSLEGDLWRWDGFSVSASAASPSARRLAEKNRLTDLISEAEAAKTLYTAHKKSAEVADATLKLLINHEAKSRDLYRLSSREVDQARDKLITAERLAAQIQLKMASFRETKTLLSHSLNEALQAVERAKTALSQSPLIAPLEEALQTARLSLTLKRTKASEARAIHEGLKRENEARRARIEAIDRDITSWVKRAETSQTQISALKTRQEQAQIEQKSLIDAPDYYAEKRRSLSSGIREAESNRKDTSDALAIGERMVFDADRAATDTLKAFSALRETFARAEGKIEGLKARKSEIDAQINEQFECAPQALPALGGFDRMAALPDLRQIESQLDVLKKEREKLGGVNLRADLELEESETHLNKLIADRDELIEAVKKLRAAISSLNKEGRERLLASFETVNANFKRIFMQLFGGGTAELQLIESDDPLEAGLDILAMPPGKKPQTMMLLSGGEQALTAISLIFAVFLTNPAPICVLDEVDAPLDDANVERYCDLLDEMAKTTKTRFLVITHNPITMSRMDRLYGVTMAERGVSQLVSVDLQRAEMMLAAE
jgi:chromosome segregation protein